MFPELLNVCRDGCVRHFENFRHTAVIQFDLEYLRPGVSLWKFENVLKVRAAPGVNLLRVITHHHHVAMIACEQVHQVGLDFVRVLILIYQNELKLFPINLRDPFVLLKHE